MGSEAKKERNREKLPNSSGRAVPREATWRVKKPDIPRDSGLSHSNADMVRNFRFSLTFLIPEIWISLKR